MKKIVLILLITSITSCQENVYKKDLDLVCETMTTMFTDIEDPAMRAAKRSEHLQENLVSQEIKNTVVSMSEVDPYERPQVLYQAAKDLKVENWSCQKYLDQRIPVVVKLKDGGEIYLPQYGCLKEDINKVSNVDELATNEEEVFIDAGNSNIVKICRKDRE